MKLSRFFISLCVNHVHLDSLYTLIKEHTCISALSLIVWIPIPLGGEGGLRGTLFSYTLTEIPQCTRFSKI